MRILIVDSRRKNEVLKAYLKELGLKVHRRDTSKAKRELITNVLHSPSVVNCECRTTQKFLTAADAPEGGNPPPAASTGTCSPPLPHERRTSRLPLLPSGPCGVQRIKSLSTALQPYLAHRQPRGTRAHDSSRLPPLDSGTAPRASAPAYRRFRVPGDAEPPSLVRRHRYYWRRDI